MLQRKLCIEPASVKYLLTAHSAVWRDNDESKEEARRPRQSKTEIVLVEYFKLGLAG